MPGPFWPTLRPRRNTTNRWYSRTTLTPFHQSRIATIRSATTNAICVPPFAVGTSFAPRLDATCRAAGRRAGAGPRGGEVPRGPERRRRAARGSSYASGPFAGPASAMRAPARAGARGT